jgi:hypothetical protein
VAVMLSEETRSSGYQRRVLCALVAIKYL